MKKMLAMILALAMVLSMSVFAFAADVTTNGNTDSDVKVTVNGNDTKVYRIEIKWEALEFTYTMGAWDTQTHQYGAGTWSAAKTIAIINHSNADVTAMANYVASDEPDNVDITLAVASGDTSLESAATAAFADPNTTNKANSIVYTLTASGNPQVPTTQVTVGTVTVTISGI